MMLHSGYINIGRVIATTGLIGTGIGIGIGIGVSVSNSVFYRYFSCSLPLSATRDSNDTRYINNEETVDQGDLDEILEENNRIEMFHDILESAVLDPQEGDDEFIPEILDEASRIIHRRARAEYSDLINEFQTRLEGNGNALISLEELEALLSARQRVFNPLGQEQDSIENNPGDLSDPDYRERLELINSTINNLREALGNFVCDSDDREISHTRSDNLYAGNNDSDNMLISPSSSGRMCLSSSSPDNLYTANNDSDNMLISPSSSAHMRLSSSSPDNQVIADNGSDDLYTADNDYDNKHEQGGNKRSREDDSDIEEPDKKKFRQDTSDVDGSGDPLDIFSFWND
jgi:hypothetical protein